MIADVKSPNGTEVLDHTPAPATVYARQRQAFGEWLGLDVPTRYTPEAHAAFNVVMIGDSLVTPLITGMSKRTVWMCRFLSGLLFLTRKPNPSLSQRQALQIEVVSGTMLLVVALRGMVSKRWWENAYLFFGGLLMIANALMTELDE
jgi:hypothetical protein